MPQHNYEVKTRPWILTPDEEQALGAADATAEWLYHLPSEILRQYAGKYVAAKDCSIYASAETYGALFKQLDNVDLQSVVVHYIERPGKVIYR